MWFAGLLIGMILGGISGSGSWVLVGGILGLAGGLIFGELKRGRNNPFEQRVEALEKKVTHLSAQVAALKSAHHPAMQAQPAIVVPAAPISVCAPEISPATEPAEAFEMSAFSRAILPVDTQTRGRDCRRENAPETNQPDQRHPETAPDGSLFSEHEWLANLFKGSILAKIGVDSESGLVHSASVTPANMHDSQELPRLLFQFQIKTTLVCYHKPFGLSQVSPAYARQGVRSEQVDCRLGTVWLFSYFVTI